MQKIIKKIENDGFVVIKSFLTIKEINFLLKKTNQLYKKRIQFKGTWHYYVGIFLLCALYFIRFNLDKLSWHQPNNNQHKYSLCCIRALKIQL